MNNLKFKTDARNTKNGHKQQYIDDKQQYYDLVQEILDRYDLDDHVGNVHTTLFLLIVELQEQNITKFNLLKSRMGLLEGKKKEQDKKEKKRSCCVIC